MALSPPRSLSPSKVTAFRDCALAFRFSAIDRLPQPPTVATTTGTLVHAALERLFWDLPPGQRTPDAAQASLAAAWEALSGDPDVTGLGLDAAATAALLDDARGLVANYFRLEDPNRVTAVGIELTLEAPIVGTRLRGIIDRLDLDGDDLVVVDYKTGRAPGPQFEQAKLLGVHLYALLCEEVLGRRPVRLRLLHLREPTVIEASPTEQALRGQRARASAVWTAIERACERDDFRPRPGPLCAYCAYRDRCPAQGGAVPRTGGMAEGAA
ncbi:MAG: PD-(D/E)XK nuclease family protein [Actinomycetota bacterium]|nr:PD-(D/E)XK nuclease family protein [Actinomycetota bacterium]